VSDYFAPAVTSRPLPVVASAVAPAPAAPPRRWPVLVGAAVALVGLAAGGWWWTGRGVTGLQLPDTLAGVAPAAAEMDLAGRAAREASEGSGTKTVGRSYGAVPGTSPLLLNLLVTGGQTDLEISLAADGTASEYGEVSCTQTLELVEGQQTVAVDKHVLCWRTSRRLTVSLLVLGTDPSFVPAAAAAVQEVWDLQG